ncbi:MAG TPA: acetyl-CoA carboxylase carboxyltransferase subunit alpha [Rhizomicrobium sp.]|jgi:acetyl-CoA carboxylase carboxyl transferase subunit alpha|nr:acetyl-CoA carboxylase carboxyltransferase subunit alpha [Rhizomicrobium sp.]
MTIHAYLEFERPIAELEGKIVELRQLAAADPSMDIEDDVARLQAKASALIHDTYGKLTPWQKALVARHPARPHCSEYISVLIDEYTPLAGDRLFGEDRAVMAGLGRFRGRPVAIVGHEKGNDTKSRLKHNFGMAMPEGYRKAQRLFELADRFKLPVLSFADTQGAYPGVGAEERGQAEAIARSTQACLALTVPFVATVIGEGMSGGALGIAVANRVYMLEHSIYSVISPEGCASILWRSSDKAQDAAAALRITAQDLLELKVIDGIVTEPAGGAHRAPHDTIEAVGEQISRALSEMNGLAPEELRKQRRDKYLAMGRNLGT